MLSLSVFAFALVYDVTEIEESVKEVVEELQKERILKHWQKSYALVTECGEQIELLESVKGIWRGGERPKDKKPLGRAATATPEQHAKYLLKTARKQVQDFQRTVNKNEPRIKSFDTFSCGDRIVKDPDVMIYDRENFIKRVIRAVRKKFDPSFVLIDMSIYSFQDGKRSKKKGKHGRMGLHLHSLNNLPFWQAFTIVGHVDHKERYLLDDGTWSIVAKQNTQFFDGGDSDKEANQAMQDGYAYIKAHREAWKRQGIKQIHLKRVPMYAIIWGHGFCYRRWFKKHIEEHGRGAKYDSGLYMASNYMLTQDVIDKLTPEEAAKFEGKQRFLHTQYRTNEEGEEVHPGGLERPGKSYDHAARFFLEREKAWDCLTEVFAYHPQPDEETVKKAIEEGKEPFDMGWFIVYRFNLKALYNEEVKAKTIPLGDRSLLKLPPELDEVMTEYELESIRREKEKMEALQAIPRDEAPRIPSPAQISLDDDWTRPIYQNHFWG